MLTALSLGAGAGAGFFAAGLLDGGAGGVGFALAPGCGMAPLPLIIGATTAGGAGGGVGLGASLTRYADGAHPCAEPSSFLPSHHPFPSCCMTSMISSF